VGTVTAQREGEQEKAETRHKVGVGGCGFVCGVCACAEWGGGLARSVVCWVVGRRPLSPAGRGMSQPLQQGCWMPCRVLGVHQHPWCAALKLQHGAQQRLSLPRAVQHLFHNTLVHSHSSPPPPPTHPHPHPPCPRWRRTAGRSLMRPSCGS
jgi:hypothetical protein